ncbi:MAG: hypothetical protein MR845_07980 [Subdoligranulum variabile]|nr:hypothetical protein [Subdoligranulum variabile]
MRIENKIMIGCVCVILLFSALICCWSQDEDALVLSDEFLITFVGVVLGIAATIITFIFSSTEKVWKVISNVIQDEKDVSQVNQKFKDGYKELIDDTKLIFVIFVLLVVCMVISGIDIPGVSMPNVMPKYQVLNYIKVALFLGCLCAIGDLFFSLLNILKLALFETK